MYIPSLPRRRSTLLSSATRLLIYVALILGAIAMITPFIYMISTSLKTVNDVYGHPVGNDVLVEVATRLRAEVREVDTIARYGGEEFVVVLPESDTDGAGHTADRICAAMRGTQPSSRPCGAVALGRGRTVDAKCRRCHRS